MAVIEQTIFEMRTLSWYARMMILFRDQYPQQFEEWNPQPLADDKNRSEALEAFLDCLDQNFPVAVDGYWLNETMSEGMFPYIPIDPRGLSYEMTPDSIGLAFRVIEAATSDYFRDRLMRSIVGRPLGKRPDYETLKKICEGQPRPLCWVIDAYEMLGHSTGNFWLDFNDEMLAECCEMPEFTTESIAWLTEEWQAAQPILEHCKKLSDWLEKDTLKRTRRVVNLLKHALREEPIRVHTTALLNTLNLENDYED